MILTRTQGIRDLKDATALKIDAYTKVISGIVHAVSRNAGDDEHCEWVDDGHWYNEAVEGIYVIHLSSHTTIGLADNDGKGEKGGSTFTMDPNVSGKSTGTKEKFKNGVLVQFRAVPVGNGANNPKALTSLPSLEDMFISRPFLVSSNVQELD